jgi:hypothetical protein
MDVRPDRFHQLLLAQDAASIRGEQPQYLQGLGPQLDRLAIGPAQLGALRIELKTRKAQHRPLQTGNCPHFVPGSTSKMCPNPQARRISEKFQNVPGAISGPSDGEMRGMGS